MFYFNKKIKENQLFRKSIFPVLLLLFLILAIGVWYSPIVFKGYPANSLPANLILAKNLATNNLYGMESKIGVVLSSNLLNQEATESSLGNKLTSIIYSQIFKNFRLLNINKLLFLSCFLYALSLIFFMLTVKKIFDKKISIFFGLVYIFIPVQWALPLSHFISYEFATLFFSVFIFLYFTGLGKKKEKIYLISSGVFLALSAMAKEVFLLFIPVFIIYLFIIKKRRELIYFTGALIVLLGVFWLPNLFNNVYFGHLNDKLQETTMSKDFEIYGEFFADPYSYYFQKDEILANVKIEKSFNPLKQLQPIKLLSNVGIRTPNIYERLFIGTFLFFKQNFKILSLEQTGGPLIFIIFLGGVLYLWKQEREKILFFIGWILGMSLMLSYIVLGSRSHLMDIIFPICLLIALGINNLFVMIEQNILIKKKILIVLETTILLLIVYNFVQTSHLTLNRLYSNPIVPKIEAYAKIIQTKNNISDNDVIAVNDRQEAYQLNYMTNKSLVIFKDQTLEKLLVDNKLQTVFDQYNVHYLVGYNKELSEKIIKTTNVTILSEDISASEPEPSNVKKQFLNFFR